MAAFDFTHLSPRNAKYQRHSVVVANGATFTVLDMNEKEKGAATNVIYLHVHKETKKCYVGVTVQEARKRWFTSRSYYLNPRFGGALKKHGWKAFDSFVLAFAEDRIALNLAEVAAIAAAGGHKSKFTYNLSPGGDMVAENDKPIVGVFLPTGVTRKFKSGSEAARILGFKNTDSPMTVARGENMAAGDWWFRLVDDKQSQPPKIWGEKLRLARMRELNARPLMAIRFDTRETRRFDTMDMAAKELGVHQSEVWSVAHGKTHSAGGWWFRFEDDDRSMPTLRGSKATRLKRDKKVFAVNLKTAERREFRNCTVADNELRIYKGASASVAGGERTSAADWWFTYDKTTTPPTAFKGALVARARSKAVVATNLATGVEQVFSSAKAAAEALGMSRASISYVISGKKSTVKGYRFRFA